MLGHVGTAQVSFPPDALSCAISSQDVELLAKNYMTNKGDVHFMVRNAIVTIVASTVPPVTCGGDPKLIDQCIDLKVSRKLKIQQTTQLYAENMGFGALWGSPS